MPSLCTNLVTRIPDRFELVRPKRGNSNEGGRHIARIAQDDSLSLPYFQDSMGKKERGSETAPLKTRSEENNFSVAC